MFFHSFSDSAHANSQWNQPLPPNKDFDLLDLKTHRESSICPEWGLDMASGYRFFFPYVKKPRPGGVLRVESCHTVTLCRARNTDLWWHPRKGVRSFWLVSWQKWFFSEDLHELVALRVSRQSESRRVRGMETGMESGEEAQDKQSTRARVTARWE